MITILDAYTDEPAGLGVPPYLGTYPRYVYGKYALEGKDVNYITIDDLRLFVNHDNKIKPVKGSQKTDITTYNLTVNSPRLQEVLEHTDELIIVCGVHVPGKYLSAMPGTINEIARLLKKLKLDCKKVLTGPAMWGTQLHGGKFSEDVPVGLFNEVRDYPFTYDELTKVAVAGAGIMKHIDAVRMIEIETGKGCPGKCSFCTEPFKNKLAYREAKDILEEVKAFCDQGHTNIRLGKQTCYYSHPQAIEILKGIREQNPNITILHIDNVNPMRVPTPKGIEITKAIVKYCTDGNIAAFGVESFDPALVKANCLNSKPDKVYEAVKIINELGRERGPTGMPKFLPGINILFGLIGENRQTHEENMKMLQRFVDEDLWLRRINIRQVGIFEGTMLKEMAGNKFLKKNKKYYWKWRNDIRQKIDLPMLDNVVPIGHVLHDVVMEIYDGKTTFGRQLGTYPLVVGVKGRHEIGKSYSVKVKKHNLRSIECEIVS